MYKAIIFDFFDVIRRDPLNNWLNKHNYEKDANFNTINQKLDLGDLGVEEFFIELHKQSGYPIETMKQAYEGTVETHQEISSLITKLGEHYKIGLLSNAPSEYLRGLLNKHDYEKLFHEVVISGEVGLNKPNREAFEHVLKKLMVKPQESIFIDDKQKNVQAAEKLGITGVQFVDLAQLKRELAKLGVEVS